MIIIRPKLTLSKASKIGNAGKSEDVSMLMEQLSKDAPIVTCKLIDYAIGLIKTEEGISQLKHYLFEGTEIQRKYAALYFKRNNNIEVLKEAVRLNCIEPDFAFCK